MIGESEKTIIILRAYRRCGLCCFFLLFTLRKLRNVIILGSRRICKFLEDEGVTDRTDIRRGKRRENIALDSLPRSVNENDSSSLRSSTLPFLLLPFGQHRTAPTPVPGKIEFRKRKGNASAEQKKKKILFCF